MSTLTTHRRLIAIGLALLFAALAAAALLSYVRGVERNALRGVRSVEVYVAKDSILAGTSATDAVAHGLIVREAIPAKAVANNVITSLSQIQGKVAAVTIVKGEQIIAERFASASQVTGVLPIPADRQALSLEVGTPPGAGGFVQPGNRVSVLAKIEAPKTGGGTTTRVQYLVQNVQVLAVGTRVASVPGGSAASAKVEQQDKVLLTLAVTPAEAEKLTYALFNGDVYFTLLPPNAKTASTSGRTADNEFN